MSSASDSQWVMARKIVKAKDVAIALIFFVTIILAASGVVTKINDKPDAADVEQSIKRALDPVAADVRDARDNLAKATEEAAANKRALERQQQVQSVTIEALQWQGEVLTHLAERRPGKPKPKPESLSKAERDLLR
jgi:hypothetical protein